jgi:hypothetical protein
MGRRDKEREANLLRCWRVGSLGVQEAFVRDLRTSLKKHPLDLELMRKLLREAPLLWETGNQRVRP